MGPCYKDGQCQHTCRIVNLTNLVRPTSKILLTKSQGHWPSGSGNDDFKEFLRPSCSYDQDHLHKRSFPILRSLDKI